MMEDIEVSEGFKMTEIGPLPEEWEVVKLGEIATIKGGKRLPKGHHFSDRLTPFPYIRVVDFADWSVKLTDLKYLRVEDKEIIERYTITTDDVYISIAGTIGLVGTVPQELDGANLTENAARLIINDKGKINKYYIVAFLSSEIGREEIDIRTTKTSQPKLALSRIKQISVSIPSFSEQKQIAYVLSTIRQAIEKTEAVINATKELKKSMMKHLFTYGPVSVEEAENVVLKETDIGPIPEEWKVASLGKVAESFIGGGTPSTNKEEFWNGDIHWTTSKGIDGIFLENGERKITQLGLEKSSTHLIPKNNLIIGTRVGIGKVAVNKIDIAISQDLTTVFVDGSKYDKVFLAYQITTGGIQNFLKECTRGTTIKGIPREDLKNVKLKVPPLHTQRKIANTLSTIDQKIETEQIRKKALEELFRTLLYNLMTGRIRVTHLVVPHD